MTQSNVGSLTMFLQNLGDLDGAAVALIVQVQDCGHHGTDPSCGMFLHFADIRH